MKLGPAVCKACRMHVYLFPDNRWYEDRLGFRWHTAKRCEDARRRVA